MRAAAEVCHVVRVFVRPEGMVRFQALIQAEEGLGVVRCRDPKRRVQEIWTTEAMLGELLALLARLPPSLDVRLCAIVPWREGM